MWLGDLEAEARKEERAGGYTQEEIACIDEKPTRESKAEWFRPFQNLLQLLLQLQLWSSKLS